MRMSEFDLAETCMEHAKDYSGLLLLCTAAGKDDKLASLAKQAQDDEKTNIAFISMLLRGKVCVRARARVSWRCMPPAHTPAHGRVCVCAHLRLCVRYACLCLIASRLTQQHRQVSECVNLLVETNRLPEAALFARSYCPSRIKDVLAAWKEDVGKANDKAARMLADPEEYANLFPELSFTKAAEAQIASGSSLPPASAYSKVVAEREVPLAERLSGGGGGGGGGAATGGSGVGSRASSPRKEVDDADLELDDDDLGDGGDDDDDGAGGGDGDDDDKELDELLAAEDEDGEE